MCNTSHTDKGFCGAHSAGEIEYFGEDCFAQERLSLMAVLFNADQHVIENDSLIEKAVF